MTIVRHDHDGNFCDWLAAANIEPNKLYTLCNEPVYWSDIQTDVARAYPKFDNMVPVTIIEKAIMNFYAQHETVRFSTVLRKTAYDFGLQGLFDREALQKIAEVFGAVKNRKQLFFEAYMGPIDWERGSFGNPNSCYWSERPGAKLMLDKVFAEGNGGAFRIYSAIGNGPRHPDNSNVRGYGRLWAVMYHHGAVIFNPYPGHNLFDAYIKGLEKALGTASNRASLRNMGEDDGTLYINKGEGCYLSRVMRDSDLNVMGLDMSIMEQNVCHRCGNETPERELFHCNRRGTVCNSCCVACYQNYDNECREGHARHWLWNEALATSNEED